MKIYRIDYLWFNPLSSGLFSTLGTLGVGEGSRRNPKIKSLIAAQKKPPA